MDDDAFSNAGVRLSYLVDDFIRDVCGGLNSIQGWTTTEVCERIIKPKTRRSEQSSLLPVETEKEGGTRRGNMPEQMTDPVFTPNRFHCFLMSSLCWPLPY